MKKFKPLMGLIAIVLVSCCNELSVNDDELVNNNEMNNVSAVYINNGNTISRAALNGGAALRFKDSLTLNNFKDSLRKMTDFEKENVIKEYGVKNLYDIAQKAEDELEEIGEKAKSEDEFKKMYAEYVKKYNGKLIQNDMDNEDLDLYVPDEDNIMSYIGNEQGLYVVGNKICNANLSKDLSESTRRLTKAVKSNNSEPVNTFVYNPKKHKRVYFDAYMQNERMRVRMYCKKKMWYGWKNDPNRYYYFDTNLSNFIYLAAGRYGQEIPTGPMPRYIINKNAQKGFDFILGKIPNYDYVTGEIDTWTDMTSEHDSKGNEITEIKGGQVVPKCLKSNAKTVKIYLKQRRYE